MWSPSDFDSLDDLDGYKLGLPAISKFTLPNKQTKIWNIIIIFETLINQFLFPLDGHFTTEYVKSLIK